MSEASLELVVQLYYEEGFTLAEIARKLRKRYEYVRDMLLASGHELKSRGPRVEIGDVFGNLTITGYDKGPGSYICTCACGNIRCYTRHKLTSGNTRSCGCLRRELVSVNRWQGVGELSKSYWANLRQNAAARNLAFDITMEDAWNLFISQGRRCNLSGLPIAMKGRRGTKGEQTASLDRIASDRGYTPDNIQWLHVDVNKMKWDFEEAAFIRVCEQVTKQQRKKRRAQPQDASRGA